MELRKNSFMQDLELNRVKARYNSNYRNKKLGYIPPINFSTISKKEIITEVVN